MTDIDTGREEGWDEQDGAEALDEDVVGNDGELRTFEELPDVLDVTQAEGDADEDDFDPDAEVDLDDQLALDGIEREADALLGVDGENRSQLDADGEPTSAPDEVELVYSGLMENERGAQASAAHWEAKRLSDDDISDLGYGPDGDQDGPAV